VLDYCNAYGDSLIEGWGRRRTEWQIGIGFQHEILPRLSAEVTFNRRMYSNILVTDELNLGCDRFLGAMDVATCNQLYLDYTHPDHAFFSFVAPTDPRLPGGGGYRITGLNTENVASGSGPEAQTFMPELESSWNGFDTNFVWRGPGGLRVNGGTSTGRSNLNTCRVQLDDPDVKGREGLPYRDGCASINPWQTRVNGTVAYVVPFVDVLVSTVFQGFRGVQRSANLDVDKSLVDWGPGYESRATDVCENPDDGVGCFGATRDDTETTLDLLNSNELFGERITLFDLKLAKNIRFGSRRLTVGVDVYNLFNSDAITGYVDNWTTPDPVNGIENEWGNLSSLVNPRFARFSLQLSF